MPMHLQLPNTWRRSTAIAPLTIFLVIAFVIPVATILVLAVWSPAEGLQLTALQRITSTPVYRSLLLRTLEISAWTTLLCLLLGFPIALLIQHARGQRRLLLYLLVLLPFWTSYLVKSFAWMVLLGRNGPLKQLLSALGWDLGDTTLLFNHTAVLVGMVHALLPFAVLIILPVLDAIDRCLMPAATSLGAGPFEAFVRVLLPLARPGLGTAALIIFITSAGFFIVPALLGGPRQTMIANVLIEMVLELMNWPLAAAASLLMFVVSAALFVLYVRAFGMESLIGRSRMESSGHRSTLNAGRGARLRRGLWKAWDRVSAKAGPLRRLPGALQDVLVYATIAFLALPTLFLVPISFTTSGIIDWPPEFFSLKWYEALNTPTWRAAAGRSFSVALATGALSLALAYPASTWFVRHAGRTRMAVLILMMSPMVVPRIIVAIGLFYLFAKLSLVGTWVGLVVGHTIIALPFVVMTMIAVVQAYDERLDQAAAICGAGTGMRLWRVTWPLLAPGAVSAFLFAFVTSLDELTIAMFVTGGLSSTLPKQMWDEALLRVSPTLAAASALIFLLMSTLVLAAVAMRNRRTPSPV